jgi:hypothetical protein
MGIRFSAVIINVINNPILPYTVLGLEDTFVAGASVSTNYGGIWR